MTQGGRRPPPFRQLATDKADHLKKERSSESTVETTLKRVREAEKLADEIAAKLQKLQDLRVQGKI